MVLVVIYDVLELMDLGIVYTLRVESIGFVANCLSELADVVSASYFFIALPIANVRPILLVLVLYYRPYTLVLELVY